MSNSSQFSLNETTELNLDKIKVKDFYWLFINKNGSPHRHTGPMKWDKTLSINEGNWETIFTLVKKICKENKLKEFHFKFVHRAIVTKRELFKFGIKDNDDCLYCDETDSINHSFIYCCFTKSFLGNVIQWFNHYDSNNTRFSPTTEQTLFGIMSSQHAKNVTKKTKLYSLIYEILYLHQ